MVHSDGINVSTEARFRSVTPVHVFQIPLLPFTQSASEELHSHGLRHTNAALSA